MPLLELEQLTKYFGGLPAVHGLDLLVEKGEIVGLIGPNGAGKTTVFNLISGYLSPTKGKVIFKGEEITGLKMHKVAKRGLVRTFQHSTLFTELTVLQNLLIGLHLNAKVNLFGDVLGSKATQFEKKRLEEKALELLELMELARFRDYPSSSLTHGYQRLLGVAIALAADPELILLDEPATGMNPEERKLMMQHIRSIAERGITVLLVEHSMRVVMGVCERICFLNFGEKMAEGRPEEIQRDKRVIEAYLGTEYGAGS
jgi:branched-chain amino acid transport system ATP-binding protein